MEYIPLFVRSLLCNLVRVKLGCYELECKNSQSVEDYLKAFMETEVKPLWPKGWMQARWVSTQWLPDSFCQFKALSIIYYCNMYIFNLTVIQLLILLSVFSLICYSVIHISCYFLFEKLTEFVNLRKQTPFVRMLLTSIHRMLFKESIMAHGHLTGYMWVMIWFRFQCLFIISNNTCCSYIFLCVSEQRRKSLLLLRQNPRLNLSPLFCVCFCMYVYTTQVWTHLI